jgi:hypothetical protein
VSADKVIRGAATVAACMVAAIGVAVTGIRLYALGRGHGQDQAVALLLPVSTAGLVVVASLVLLHEARNRRAAPGLARVMLWTGIAAMAGAGARRRGGNGCAVRPTARWPARAEPSGTRRPTRPPQPPGLARLQPYRHR